MTFQMNRLGRFIFLFSTVSLVLGIAGIVYYLKIKQNERYLNQLHFRELNTMQVSLENGFEGLKRLGERHQRTIDMFTKDYMDTSLYAETLPKIQESYNSLLILKRDVEQKKRNMDVSARKWQVESAKSESQKARLKMEEIKLAELRRDREVLSRKLTSKTENLSKARKSVRELKRGLGDPEEFVPEYFRNIVEQCGLGDGFCDGIEAIYDGVFSFEVTSMVATDAISDLYRARYTKQICAIEKDCKQRELQKEITKRKQFLTDLAERFTMQGLTALKPDELGKFLFCSDLYIWPDKQACFELEGALKRHILASDPPSEIINGKETTLETNEKNDNVSHVHAPDLDEINVKSGQIKRLIAIQQAKLDFVDRFISRVKSLDVINAMPPLLTAYQKAKEEEEAATSALDDMNSKIGEAENARLENPDAALGEESKALFDNAKKSREEFVKSKDRFKEEANSVKKMIRTFLAQINSGLTGFGLVDVNSTVKDYLLCLDSINLDIGTHVEINPCSHKEDAIRAPNEDDMDDKLGDYINKSMRLTQAAFPSISFRHANRQETLCGAKHSCAESSKGSLNLIPPEVTGKRGLWKLALPLKKCRKFVGGDTHKCDKYETKRAYGELSMSFSDLLPNKSQHFPMILLVDDQGRLVYRQDNIEVDAFQSGLHFEVVDEILQALAANQKKKKTPNTSKTDLHLVTGDIELGDGESRVKITSSNKAHPGYSGQLDIRIAGQSFSVFVSPWNQLGNDVSDRKGKAADTLYYLVGVTPKSKLLVGKLAIANSTLVALVFALLAIVAVIPVLKIRLVSYKQSFSRADRQHVAFGLSMLCILLISGLVHFTLYSHLKALTKQQHESVFNEVRHSFRKEVADLHRLANKQLSEVAKGITYTESDPINLLLKRSEKWDVLENVFYLDTSGNYAGTIAGPRAIFETIDQERSDGMARNPGTGNTAITRVIKGKWSTDVNRVRTDFPLGHRAYYKAAKACKGWQLKWIASPHSIDPNIPNTDSDCDNRLFIERIMSLSDGRKTTQFSQSFVNKDENLVGVYSFGAKIQTFMASILPADVGFAVFRDENGEVIYHSDDERSLVENIFVETDNSDELRSLSRRKLHDASVSFSSTYNGRPHLFTVGKLDDNIPWTLVIFHDREALWNTSMLMGFSGLILLLALLFIGYVIYLLLQTLGYSYKLRTFTWVNTLYCSRKLYGRLAGILVLMAGSVVILYFWARNEVHGGLSSETLLVLLVGYWAILWVMLKLFTLTNATEDETATELAGTGGTKTSQAYLHPNLRDRFAYTLYMVALLTAIWGPPSYVLMTESAAFYLQHYVDRERERFAAQYQSALESKERYLNLLLDNMSLPDDQTELVGKDEIRNFSGHHKERWVKPSTDDNERNDESCDTEDCESKNENQAKAQRQEAKADIKKSAQRCVAKNESKSAVVEPDELPVLFFSGSEKSLISKGCPLDEEFVKHWGHELAVTRVAENGFLSWLWRKVDLGYDLASDYWLANTLHRKWALSSADLLNPSINIHRFFFNALGQWGALSFVFLLLGLGLLLWLVNKWVCLRLIGLNVPQNLRLGDSQYKINNVEGLLKLLEIQQPNTHKSRYVQVIRVGLDALSLFDNKRPFTDKVEHSAVCKPLVGKLNLLSDSPVHLADFADLPKSRLEDEIKNRFGLFNADVCGTAVMTGLEMTAMDKTERRRALDLLDLLMSYKHVNIVLLSDVAPLYRLTRLKAYPATDPEHQAEVQEVVHWSKLMKNFTKFYDWTPDERKSIAPDANPYETLKYEKECWPELHKIYYELLHYHCAVKDQTLIYSDKKVYKLQRHATDPSRLPCIVEASPEVLEHSINDYWLSEQVQEFFGAHAGPAYRYRWELCTREERLLLIQMANSHSPNPLNIEPIEHLVRRGYIFRCDGWHLVNNSFARFVLSAESPETVAEWMQDAQESSWRYIKTPIFVAILVTLGFFAYTATAAFESFVAIATAMVGVLPLMLRGIGLMKGDSASMTDGA